MGKTLVLAEKPSVGKEIARVLGCRHGGEGCLEGGNYVVTWALGHLVELAAPEVYDKSWEKWDMLTLPMLPKQMKTVVIKETSRQFKVVSNLMRRGDISQMVIATDAGREGELVARWIMEKAGWRKPTQRLWISSQTDKAIREGFANLKPAAAYETLFFSARARSQADWLVGLNVTRALTCRFGAQLSAGRVQTPTLALITQREEEIRAFKPQDYWTVSVKTPGFVATWRDKTGAARIFQREKAQSLAQRLEGKDGVLTAVQKTYKQQSPPAAYDLTELQRDANKKYAYSAKETLSIMQALYEHHKVLTYPRTDSRYIPQDVVPTLNERLRSVAVGEYKELALQVMKNRPLQTRFLVNDAKVSDHHAIIPTEEMAELHKLSGPERNVYDLVVRRFLAVLMPPFEYEETKLTLTVDKEVFTAKGKIVKTLGWKGAYDRSFSEEEEEEEEKSQSLPPMKQGDRMTVTGVRLHDNKTAPPKRYNEATLLTAMEHPASQVEDRVQSKILEETGGLGTPATRADIIEKLFSAFYVERKGKEIVPTSKGIQLVGLVPEELRSAQLTAQWEGRLARIAQGQEKDTAFVGEMGRYAASLVSQVKASVAVYRHDNVTREKCPECEKFLLRVKGKRGEMLVCPDRECGYRRSLTQTSNARCPTCHKKMELRGDGDKQTFACICGYREKLADFKKRNEKSGANKREVSKFLESQQEEKGTSALAEQLKKWKEMQG